MVDAGRFILLLVEPLLLLELLLRKLLLELPLLLVEELLELLLELLEFMATPATNRAVGPEAF